MTNEPILKLIEKAAAAEDSGEAMRFSQAASNAAHALVLCKDNSIGSQEETNASK